MMVVQLRTGHSPLLARYLHRIGQDSRTPGATVPSSRPGPEGRQARKKIQRGPSTPLGLSGMDRGRW